MANNKTNPTQSAIKWGTAGLAVISGATTFQPFSINGDMAMNASRNVSAPSSATIDPLVYLDVKIEASEARMSGKIALAESQTETKFAQLIGKLDLISDSIGDLKANVGRLDGKIDAVDGHTRTAKRDVLIAIVSAALAVSALAWAGVQIYQSSISIGMEAAKTAADVKRK